MKGVTEPWHHKGNVLRIGPRDFPEEYRERNWNIYNMRIIEHRTLSHIAEKHGLSRERVRQIVAKGMRIMRTRKWVRGENAKKAQMGVGALPLSVRLQRILANELGKGWDKLSILLFVGVLPADKFLALRNVGRHSFLELYNKIKEVDEDVAYIWTSGHGEDYNPAKHGGRSVFKWDTSE